MHKKWRAYFKVKVFSTNLAQQRLTALYKIKEVLFEDLKMTIESNADSDDKRFSFENIQMLLTTVRTLKKLSNIDEVALVYGPY